MEKTTKSVVWQDWAHKGQLDDGRLCRDTHQHNLCERRQVVCWAHSDPCYRLLYVNPTWQAVLHRGSRSPRIPYDDHNPFKPTCGPVFVFSPVSFPSPVKFGRLSHLLDCRLWPQVRGRVSSSGTLCCPPISTFLYCRMQIHVCPTEEQSVLLKCFGVDRSDIRSLAAGMDNNSWYTRCWTLVDEQVAWYMRRRVPG